jgi:hypothetical protein
MKVKTSSLPRKIWLWEEGLQGNAIEECDPCMIAAACTIETIIEDPFLPILKKDSNITKPTWQIRRPGLDHDPPSPRFKLFMIDLIPHPEISMFFNVRFYIRKILRLSLRKKLSQSFFSWSKYIPFTPLSASGI